MATFDEDPKRNKIYKFVLTGGPCAGKTTAMDRIQVFLRERGYRVFVAPEAPTILFTNGCSVNDLSSRDGRYAFQKAVIRTQMSFEEGLVLCARSTGQDSVILCDRGVMDGSAYVEKDVWDQVLSDIQIDVISARDSRYDAVFHLVTCAEGAEASYTLTNNEARTETVEQARQVDKNLQLAWTGHPHHFIIDNRDKTFEKKLEKLVSLIASMVGLPTMARRSRKFPLLEPPKLVELPSNAQRFEVEKIMLLSPDHTNDTVDTADKELYRFIRKRSQSGFSSYGLTVVKQSAGQKVELKEVITAKTYAMLAKSAVDKSHRIVRQVRYCFIWEQQSFHIYQYLDPQAGLWLLLCQSEGEPVLPSFVHAGPEIQNGDDALSSYSLSLI